MQLDTLKRLMGTSNHPKRKKDKNPTMRYHSIILKTQLMEHWDRYRQENLIHCNFNSYRCAVSRRQVSNGAEATAKYGRTQ
jgi:hypothetical protein